MSARRHSLMWWAQKIYDKSYLDLTDEEALAVYDAREEAENGEVGESQSVASDGGTSSENLA